MKCSACKGGVTSKEAVLINGKPYHVECFSQGLSDALAPVRAAIQTLNEFELAIEDKADRLRGGK